MRNHPERMDAGIRAARTVNPRIAGKEFGQCCFDLLLHAGADFLHLPPFVSSAIIGDGEFEFEVVHKG